MIPDGMEEYYNYLENLRRSGIVNMFGAAPYLAGEFGLKMREARRILTSWMSNYNRADYEQEDWS